MADWDYDARMRLKKADKEAAQQARKESGKRIEGTHIVLVIFIVLMGWMFYSIANDPNVVVNTPDRDQTPPRKEELPVLFDGPGLLLQNREAFDSTFGPPQSVQSVSDDNQQVIYHHNGIEHLINFNAKGLAYDTHINRIDGKPLAIFDGEPRYLLKLAGYKDRSPDHVGEIGIHFGNVENAGEVRFMVFGNEIRDMMVDAPAP